MASVPEFRLGDGWTRFVDGEAAIVLVENVEGDVLALVAHDGLGEVDRDAVAGTDARVGMDGDTIEQERILPFQALDQAGGERKLAPEH